MAEDLKALAELLKQAKAPEYVFGGLGGDVQRALTLSYRKIVQRIHPDKFTLAADIEEANGLIIRLGTWKSLAEQKIADGTYGDNQPGKLRSASTVVPQVIKTPRRTYFVKDLIAVGDLADLYAATYTDNNGKVVDVAVGGRVVELDEGETPVVFKIVQNAGDNDLLENESRILGKIYPPKQAEEKFYRYLPRLVDSFQLRSKSGPPRRVNVLQLLDGFCTLAQVNKIYPKGLDYRDVAWMFRRMMEGLWFLHEKKGVVHGAILPTHVMVHPIGHGARFVGWSYAVELATYPIKAISTPYKNFYPAEVLTKRNPGVQTDVYMMGKCVVFLLGGNVDTNEMPGSVPKQFQQFVKGCLLPNAAHRPDNMRELHEELTSLLEKLVGRPTYRPLSMPGKL